MKTSPSTTVCTGMSGSDGATSSWDSGPRRAEPTESAKDDSRMGQVLSTSVRRFLAAALAWRHPLLRGVLHSGVYIWRSSRRQRRNAVYQSIDQTNIQLLLWLDGRGHPLVSIACLTSNNPLPLSPVGCLPSQCVQVLLAPIRVTIRPFSTWSPFPCFALHHNKHYGF